MPESMVMESQSRRLAAHFGVSLVLFTAFFMRLPILWDADSYYHLAVARLYGTEGILARVPWGRFSLLSGGGDKDFLFHLLIWPFAAMPDAAFGGRIALGLWNAVLATVIAWLAVRAIGAAGYAVPLFLWVAAPPFFARVVRLRPELLALLIIILAITAAAHRRYRILAVLGFAFALGYTAFHVFLALCFLWFVWDRIVCGSFDLRLMAAPTIGSLAGLVLRPDPMANFRIWILQNVTFFVTIGHANPVEEVRPPAFLQVLILTSVWLLTLILLMVLTRREWTAPRALKTERSRELVFTAISAAVFVFLFIGLSRMSTYVFPLLTLTALRFIGPISARRIFVFLAATLLAIPLAMNPVLMGLLRGSGAYTELDGASFGKAVPPGAKVAADWGSGELYAFWAPQGRYLNMLDPIFMAQPHPREFAVLHRLFAGETTDIPAAMRALDSDYLAFDWTDASPGLIHAVRSEKRLETVYGGYNVLLHLKP